MSTRRTVLRAAGAASALVLALSGAGAATAKSHSPAPAVAAPTLASTIALNNCSGSLVRYPSSAGTDRGLLLTNGHCYEGGFLADGQVIQNKASSRTGKLLDANARTLATVRADRLLYATMTGTDVALYRLTSTYDSISRSTGAKPLTLSTSKPVAGSAISIPSSYWKTTYRCSVQGFVPTLREGQWTWHDSIRYGYPDSDCVTIGGTSGSPIVDDASGKVVGINNTTNEDGEVCELNNPCEVGTDGSTTATEGQNYGQETYWFTTCLTASRAIDLTKAGCLLTKP
ncbi:serine protease [Marmoricola endophyticus]|uniref:Serine protease n=1 Tax=Marmoricola endophyticus TaxID=2040280 RepID=A0A917BSK2_9ACTN|nr:serine protease [Marmoricola endophyticus]GGF55245.1 serine protease [Marmoricola endophyticus]